MTHVFAFSSYRDINTYTVCEQEPLSKSPDFFSANDRMTDTLRGPLLTAQREISALDVKRGRVLEKVAANEDAQKGAFVVATNVAETLQNTAKRAGFASTHAKLSTDLSSLEVQIREHKQVFGLEMYQIFVDLEDGEGWLPTVRDIRSIYDQARRDVDKIEAKRKEKEKELMRLGGVPLTTSSESSQVNGTHHDDDDDPKQAYFKQAAAKDSEIARADVPNYGGASSSTHEPYNNNSHPSYGMATAASQPPTTYADPFGSTTPQQQHQQQPVDPFASFGSAPVTTSAPVDFGSSSSSAPIHGNSGSMGSTMPPADPFAVRMDGSSSSHHDPFASTPMGTGDFFMSNSGPVPQPPAASDDPFAAFDSISPPAQNQSIAPPAQHQQQQPPPPANQQQMSGNPMFRY